MTKACGHYIASESRSCGTAESVRLFANGHRCPEHTPAAIAGEPEVSGQYCAPNRCYCRECPSWTEHNPYATNADSWVTDARHIASGKKRASPARQAAAKATVQEQKDREASLRKGAA